MEYSSIDQMAKYDCNTFRNYVAFLAGRMAPGTRRLHHDSELISSYSPITRSHFMDPTDRAIKGFYCN